MRVLALTLFVLCIFNTGQSLCPPTSLLYRTLDGKCNNVLFENWGRALTYYKNGPEGREAYPWAQVPQVVPMINYSDVDSLPTQGPRGNGRDISNAFCKRESDDEVDPNDHSMFAIFFGQFINHDMENNQMVNAGSRESFPLVTYLIDRNETQCQEIITPIQPDPVPPRCNDNDRVLTSEARATGGTLLNDQTFRAINNASAYLDLDHIYGRNENLANTIRSHSGGKLRVSTNSVNLTIPGVGITLTFTLDNLLPSYEETKLPVNPTFPDLLPNHKLIFTTGDERVNQNMPLTFFHTLFVREHNKVCDELLNANPLWKLFPTVFDELIYQRARAITIAKYQRVVFEEYLPSTFGQHFTNLLGRYNGYNPLVDTSTALPFSGAAFRYGHFMIKSYFNMDECGVSHMFGSPARNQSEKMVFLGMANPFPDFLTPLGQVASIGGFENLVRGLINEVSAPHTLSVHDDIRDLFLPSGVLDLISLDIARQRFNTLPNYQRIRKHYRNVNPVTDAIYGAPGCPSHLENSPNSDDPIECFSYITSNAELAQKLKNVYRKVNLIDAIIGVTSEDHVPGTSFGHTSGNIIMEQFKRYRDGDRFFYTNLINTGYFTYGEREAILNSSMTEILRRNLNVGEEIPADRKSVV